MSPWTAQDWAIFFGAGTAAVVAIVPIVGTFILQLLTFLKQPARDALAQTTHDLVNGLSEKHIAVEKEKSLKDGIATGVQMERANPQPAPPQP